MTTVKDSIFRGPRLSHAETLEIVLAKTKRREAIAYLGNRWQKHPDYVHADRHPSISKAWFGTMCGLDIMPEPAIERSRTREIPWETPVFVFIALFAIVVTYISG